MYYLIIIIVIDIYLSCRPIASTTRLLHSDGFRSNAAVCHDRRGAEWGRDAVWWGQPGEDNEDDGGGRGRGGTAARGATGRRWERNNGQWWEVNCAVMITPFWESITSFWYFLIAIPTGEKKNNRKVNNNLTSVWASTMVMLMLCHLYSTVSRLRSIVPFLFVPVLWWQSRHLDLSW